MILVVDDERNLADTLVAMLDLIGYKGTPVYSGEDALEIVRQQEPELIISDVVMPGINGVELAIAARRWWPNVRILLVSGNVATQEIVDIAQAKGHAFEVLAKPTPPKQLLLKIVSMLETTPIC